MAEQPLISQLIAGMNMDSLTSNLKQGQYPYALNAVIENFDGQQFTLQNEQANELCFEFPKGYKVIGQRNISQLNKTLFLLTNPETKDSEVGFGYNLTCKYETLISDVGNDCKFNFSIDYPVHKIHIKTDNCSTQAFWTDGLNPRRFIDFDDLPWVEIIDPLNVYKRIKVEGKLDCNKLKVQANYAIPEILGVEETVGGSLVTGVYQGLVEYANSLGDALTGMYNATNPISIFEQKEGENFNTPTSKAITFQISNLDTTGLFEYFNLVIVEVINNIPTPKFAGTFPISSPNYTYTYTGVTKTLRTLNVEDVFVKYPYYEIAGDSFEVDNLIGWSQLSEAEEPNYQKFWSELALLWESYAIPYNEFQGYTNGINTERYRTYMRDEVYALEGCFILTNGKQTKACHIPSRMAQPQDLEIVTVENPDNGFPSKDKCSGSQDKFYWQVYNTAYVQGTTYEHFPGDCYIGPYQYGQFAYWESTDRYPANTLIWGDLAGKPIRHHKFPDILVSPIHDNNTTNDTSFEHTIFPIGIKVTPEAMLRAFEASGLTKAEIAQIAGFKIIRGNRANNKSIIAKGLVTNVGQSSYNGKTYLYPNYPFNDLRKDPFYVTGKMDNHVGFVPEKELDGFSSEDSRKKFVFHSPDTSFYQPSIDNNGETLKFESIEFGKSIGHFVKVLDNAEYKFLTPRTINAAAGLAIASGVVIGAGTFGSPEYNIASAIPSYTGTIEMFEKLSPYTNFGYNFNSVGDFSSSYPIPNDGNKQRGIIYNKYLVEGFNGVEEGKILNNFRREGSVYIATDSKTLFPNEYSGSIPIDNSRYNLASLNDNLDPSTNRTSDICAYYASIKKELLNQWGQIYSYQTIDTGYYQNFKELNGEPRVAFPTIFGGDVFINRFSYKTKLPFFRDNTVLAPNQADIAYNEQGNLNYPMFWISTKAQRYDIDVDKEIEGVRKEFIRPSFFNIIANIVGGGARGSQKAMALIAKIFSEIYSKLGLKNVNMDRASSDKLFEEGLHYLFAYGIPYFFCESEVNVDYRQASNQREGDFYPNVGRDIPDDWLQEKNVPIIRDNSYLYNKTYSWQNDLNYFSHIREDYDPNKVCQTEFPNRAIWSEQATLEETKNNWLIYKPLSRFDFPKGYGALVSLDGIENRQVIARFENKTLLYNALSVAATSLGQVYLGKALFDTSAPPMDYADTDLGYVGSQHKLMLKTEIGHIVGDSVRGQFFLINGQNIKDLSDQGMSKFFKEYLKFSINDRFPSYPIDNHFNGCGLHGVYDNKYNRVILTKIDYTPLSDDLIYRDGKIGIITKKTITIQPSVCPPGYTLIDGICTKTITSPATKLTETSFIAEAVPYGLYTTGGSYIYSTVNADGTGTRTALPAIPFWKNVAGDAVDGPLNRTAIWNSVSGDPQNVWVGVTSIITNNTTVPKTVYVGVAGDNGIRITLNCQNIVTWDNTKIDFTEWPIYPITIAPGVNYLTIENKNVGLVGAIGYEVYDNTAAEIQAANSLDDLNILFSTADLVGETVEGFNYTCGGGNCAPVIKIGDAYYCETTYQEAPNYTTTTKEVEVFTEIPFSDERYFCNNSFTISYSFKSDGWSSMHSYIPNYYIGDNNIFFSGKNDEASLWKHNNSLTKFNNYYGIREPYIIEYPLYYKGSEEILQAVKDYSKVLAYTDYQEFVETDDVYFSHAMISNNQQHSGTLRLTKKPKNSLSTYSKYPIYHADEKEILYSKSNSLYQFNTFWALQKSSQQPMWKKSCQSVSILREINNDNMNYSKRSFNKAPIMSKDAKIRLINDEHDQYKFISQFLVTPTQTSFK